MKYADPSSNGSGNISSLEKTNLNLSNDADQTANHSQRPAGLSLSGRVVFFPFIVVIVLGLIFVLSMAIQFQRIMQGLDRTRTLWPKAQSSLSDRFRNANDLLDNNRFLDHPIDLDTWKQQQEKFRETVQFDRQVDSALALESMLQNLLTRALEPDKSSFAPLPAGDPNVEELLASERERNDAQSSFLGRWAMTLLRLKTPQVFLP
jgi:hypothetical protein